jgi:putative oxidoreductase
MGIEVAGSELSPLDALLPDIGDLLLRVATGLLLLPHGAQKLFGVFGADRAGERTLFSEVGLRPAVMWVALIGVIQFFGGVLLVLGLFTRSVSLLVALMLFGTALFVTHRGGWFWNRGGMEYSLFWAIAAVAVFCHGGGRFSVDALMRGIL